MIFRRWLCAVPIILMSGCTETAVEPIRTIDWSELQSSEQLESGEIVEGETGEEELLIHNQTGQMMTSRLATLDPAEVTAIRYQLSGTLRYEGVEQPGYLEMWNTFADGKSYFSRTLSSSGPSGRIQGSSSLRQFILPFQSSAETGPPTRLEINLVLPANGKVWISSLQISEPGIHGWWSSQSAGLIGGIGGTVSGLLGALIGTLVSRGRGRAFVISLCWLMMCLGLVSLVVGVFAFATSQPYVVYYPLLLFGVISTLVAGNLLRTIPQRYSAVELRRMDAMDTGPA